MTRKGTAITSHDQASLDVFTKYTVLKWWVQNTSNAQQSVPPAQMHGGFTSVTASRISYCGIPNPMLRYHG